MIVDRKWKSVRDCRWGVRKRKKEERKMGKEAANKKMRCAFFPFWGGKNRPDKGGEESVRREDRRERPELREWEEEREWRRKRKKGKMTYFYLYGQDTSSRVKQWLTYSQVPKQRREGGSWERKLSSEKWVYPIYWVNSTFSSKNGGKFSVQACVDTDACIFNDIASELARYELLPGSESKHIAISNRYVFFSPSDLMSSLRSSGWEALVKQRSFW